MFESFSQYIFDLSLLQEHLKLLLTHRVLQKKRKHSSNFTLWKTKNMTTAGKIWVTVFRHLMVIPVMITCFKGIALSVCLKG